MKKRAIAVYNPTDPVERAVQDAFHSIHDGWLPSHHCRLIAQALAELKFIDQSWLDHPTLLQHRVKYIFAEHMISKKDVMVFLTMPLFLRDILENEEINSFLHSPVVFVSRPLAHYLFKDYPINIYVDMDKMKSGNTDADILEIGGLTIIEGSNVVVKKAAVANVVTKKTRDGDLIPQSFVNSLRMETGQYRKVAAAEIEPGIFEISEHERILMPEQEVWDKVQRLNGRIIKVEPGETGNIEVSYVDGDNLLVPKGEFDNRYVVTSQSV